MIEYVSHLHEHFEDPVNVKNGAYHLPKVCEADYNFTNLEKLINFENI